MPSSRLHALDAIRGFALLLGLVIHGSMSFLPGLAQYGFPVSDLSKSMSLTWLFYVLHMFRMAVFFLIAGFFAHMALASKGPKAFLKNRLQRLALPMIIASVVSLLLIMPIMIWAARKLYGPDGAEQMFTLLESAPAGPITMQFWFLYYLLWFCGIATACSMLTHKMDPNGSIVAKLTAAVYTLCKSRMLVILTTAVSAGMLFGRESWIYWGGIPTPTEAVWREGPGFVIYGMAFLIGWHGDRDRRCLDTMKTNWLQYLILALFFTYYSITLINPAPFSFPDTDATGKLHFALVYAMASWCWIFFFMGAGIQFFNHESALRRYIADASYWVYIVHVPVIVFLQTLVMDVPLHWSIKFPCILLVTSVICFWTYEHWVRYSCIGRTLNGIRVRPSQTGLAVDKAAQQ